ncbi:hypothetical protein XELAEV_18036347mg [Xenopus laevis]|uniref:Uncharacterized protein n=1 Tax=Xenopus laevis TaxID=8355 RepID=A0A974CH83_XENLA|nr:hypothetical protein XELAEV_18036347mg [Xenopus laevis]
MQSFPNSSSPEITQPLDSTHTGFSLGDIPDSAKPLDMQQPSSGSASPGITQPLDSTQTGFSLGEATASAKPLNGQQPSSGSESISSL